MSLRIRNERGDTLVEVLIAMAIISLVLVGAYVTSNRNAATLQATQEREQAQRVVEAQLELLRNSGTITSGNCFDPISGSQTSGAGCDIKSSTTNSGATYKLSITGPVGGVYTVMARWTSLNSNTDLDSSVTMYYRLK
ncbi:MAG TPA: prepilin-type N-terminal cleavage/methylation domain-containing protein [Candidatus Saccharimonadales bacterium]|nr:prepilin-type N-terminal cleavage/methylation domain-containing protein [Candidatus Saccharimonadales bacterium]